MDRRRRRVIWQTRMETDIDVYVGDEHRTYRFVLDISTEDWEVEEVWWADSPISVLDSRGTLMVGNIEEDRWFVRGYGDDATYTQVYEFYKEYEEELREIVYEEQKKERLYERQEEALLELYGVD